MKRAKILMLTTLLGVGSLVPAFDASAYDLPLVEIRCERTTFSICAGIGFFSICLNYWEIQCTNGFHDWGRL